MYDIAPLIERILVYAKNAKVEPSTASYRIFGDGSRLDRLQKGKTCTVETAKAAWQRLDELEAELPKEAA